jgi:hypothetical protein
VSNNPWGVQDPDSVCPACCRSRVNNMFDGKCPCGYDDDNDEAAEYDECDECGEQRQRCRGDVGAYCCDKCTHE